MTPALTVEAELAEALRELRRAGATQIIVGGAGFFDGYIEAEKAATEALTRYDASKSTPEGDGEKTAARGLEESGECVNCGCPFPNNGACWNMATKHRADILEDAAKVAEQYINNSGLNGGPFPDMKKGIAAAIRALSKQCGTP